MRKITLVWCVFIAAMFLYSCEDDLQEDIVTPSLTEDQIDQNIKNLSEVLANAVYRNDELVKEIKEEISYRFDYDNDALIREFLGRDISGEKFEDILSNSSNGKYSSKDIEKMILESGYLQFSIPLNYESLDYETVTPLAVPIYSFINEQDTEYIESFDNDGNTVNLSAKEMPTVPVIVVGRSERIDENGNLRVSERSVIIPKEGRMHYTKAIEQARNNLKSAKINQHILTILSQEEFDKLGVEQETTGTAEYGANLKSTILSGDELTGNTTKPKEMSLSWEPYSNGTYTSNKYIIYRDGNNIKTVYYNNFYTDIVEYTNMPYEYRIVYYYNNVYLGVSNDLELQSSQRTSGGKEYIDRLYASHAMVVFLEGWWVSEIEIKWDVLIGNPNNTVSVMSTFSQTGGTSWDTQGSTTYVDDKKDVNLFTWNKGDGLSYTIRFVEDDGGSRTESVNVWVDVTALVAETILTATGDLVVVGVIEATKGSIKKVITQLKNDDEIGETIVYWWDKQADRHEIGAKSCYVEFSHR